jgi:serine/threonine protein phosphatase PrpC
MSRVETDQRISGSESSGPLIHVMSSGLTDRGKVRPSNEDHFLIAELARTLWVRQTSLPQPSTQHGRNRGHIFLVADGMGGHQAGEVASALTVASIEAFVLNVLHRFSNLGTGDEHDVIRELKAALRHADQQIFYEISHHPEFTGMGTTLTLAFVTGWKLFVMHAGDSRCYLYRDGTIRQLTHDHTLAAELARNGVISPESVQKHQFRHLVTNILGGDLAGVEVDVQMESLQSGDSILLCSDGLTDMLSVERITTILNAEVHPEGACKRLVSEANGAGGHDNITAIVACIQSV